MVVTATYSDGSTKDVTSGCGYEGFDSTKVIASQTITVKYTENGITQTTEITVSVRERKPVKVSFDFNGLSGSMDDQTFIEITPQNINPNQYLRNNDGTYYYMFAGWNTKADGSGTSYEDGASFSTRESTTLYAQWKVFAKKNGDYLEFGEWPQTLKADSVTVDENDSEVHGMFTYYKGSDGAWYVKQAENAYSDNYKYSDGITTVGKGGTTYKYFKVEPIKWCVLTNDYEYDKTNNSGDKATFLLAANILTGNVPYYESTSDRTIGENTVYANNYKESQVRAYLNGLSYQGVSKEQTTWNNKGFLQTAFCDDELINILTTEVENGGESTTDAAKNMYWANGKKEDGVTDSDNKDYTCENTNDKIFLPSVQEVTTTEYGFTVYNSGGETNSRVRKTTDFALANYAQTSSWGGFWWLRSPYYRLQNSARSINNAGNSSDQQYSNVNWEDDGVVPALCIKLQ